MNSGNGLKASLIGLSIFAVTANGAMPLTPPQLEVQRLMKKLYSFDPVSFEFGMFAKKTLSPFLLNKVSDTLKDAVYLPKQKCNLIEDYFDESLITRTTEKNLVRCDTRLRFPYMDSEEMSPATRNNDIPRAWIETPIVTGTTAKVVVYPGGQKDDKPPASAFGRNIFYLTKDPERGWRITNVLVHDYWPDIPNDLHSCEYGFANRAPTPEQERDVPTHCK